VASCSFMKDWSHFWSEHSLATGIGRGRFFCPCFSLFFPVFIYDFPIAIRIQCESVFWGVICDVPFFFTSVLSVNLAVSGGETIFKVWIFEKQIVCIMHAIDSFVSIAFLFFHLPNHECKSNLWHHAAS